MLHYMVQEVLKFQIDWNSPLWFLLCLFFSRMLFQTVVSKCGMKESLLILSFIALIGFFIGEIIWLPFSLCPAMVSTLFIFAGYIARHKLEVLSLRSFPLILVSLMTIISSTLLPTFSLESLSMKYGVLHFFPAVGGTLFLYVFVKKINNEYIRKRLATIGVFSMNILLVHTIESVISPFDKIAQSISNWEDNELVTISFNIMLAIIRIIVTLLLTGIEIKISNKLKLLKNGL